MADYSVLLMDTPAATLAEGGTGLVVPLRKVTGLSIAMPLNDIGTVDFDLPGDDYQTGLITQYVSDVIVYRDDEWLQRFRCCAVTESSSDGVVSVHYTFATYRRVVGGGGQDGWMFHDADHLNYGTTAGATTGTMEQSLVAWNVLNEGQGKAFGDIQMTRGATPATPVNIGAYPDASGTTTFFLPGEFRGAAIESKIADTSTGFEWDVEPDPNNPQTKLKFNSWNKGARTQFPGDVSPLLLSEASMQAWTRSPANNPYGNVFRGAASGTGTATLTPVYIPSGGDPSGTPPQGRWELSSDQSTVTTQVGLAAATAQDAAMAASLSRTWSVTLAPGRYTGRSQAWVGDNIRLVLSVDLYDDEGRPANKADGTPATLLDLDIILRIWAVSITADEDGNETVTLTLNRLPTGYLAYIGNLADRVRSLERLA